MSFLEKFGETLSRGLQSCYVGDVELRAAPVNKSLQSRFLSCKDKQPDTLSPVLHGTDERNLPSIYQKGRDRFSSRFGHLAMGKTKDGKAIKD